MATCWYSLRIVAQAYQKTCVNVFGSLSLQQNKEARVWDWRSLRNACRRRGEPPSSRHALMESAQNLNYACRCHGTASGRQPDPAPRPKTMIQAPLALQPTLRSATNSERFYLDWNFSLLTAC